MLGLQILTPTPSFSNYISNAYGNFKGKKININDTLDTEFFNYIVLPKTKKSTNIKLQLVSQLHHKQL